MAGGRVAGERLYHPSSDGRPRARPPAGCDARQREGRPHGRAQEHGRRKQGAGRTVGRQPITATANTMLILYDLRKGGGVEPTFATMKALVGERLRQARVARQMSLVAFAGAANVRGARLPARKAV